MPDDGNILNPDPNPFIGDITLADVVERLAADEGLTPERRRDLLSAVRRVGALLDRPLSALPAHLADLKPGLEGINPARAGITEKTWQNLRSNLLVALRHLGFARSPALHQAPLTAAWQELRDKLHRGSKFGHLNRFLRFCSAQGIAPGDVEDRTVDMFVEALRIGTFKTKKQIRDLHRRTTGLWNEAADIIDEWPPTRLSVPDHRKPPASLPLSAFPPSFGEDVERHLKWLAGEDLFAEHPPPKACRAGTIRLRRQHIVLAASAYVHRGHDPSDLRSLADLVAVQGVKEVMRDYIDKKDSEISQFTRNLCKALILIARHDIRVDAAELDALKQIKRQLGSERSGLTPKNRETLRQFDDEANCALLYNLPDAIITDALKRDTGGRHWAVQVQIALAIELLFNIPIRQENLIDLQLGRHLVRPGGDRGAWHLVLIEDETKNDEPAEFQLSERLAAILELYLSRFHLRLAGGDNPYLFPGQKGPCKTQATLSGQIKATIYKRTGLKITGHQFRHLAAKTLLDAEPANYQGASVILGHKNLKTTINYYSGLRTKQAGQHFSEIIERERSRPSSRHRRKP